MVSIQLKVYVLREKQKKTDKSNARKKNETSKDKKNVSADIRLHQGY